jgi:DNA repair exonuclease SbcCD nuclease subunit
VTLSGHIHRHQVLRIEGRPHVVYAGSVERTSFAEAAETKGYVVLELSRSGLDHLEFRELPARPMVRRTLSFSTDAAGEVHTRVAAAIGATPADAIVQLQIDGTLPPSLTAAALRAMSGTRNVVLKLRPAWSHLTAC